MRWFKHLLEASDDIKIVQLEERFQNDGYAVFFKLLEKVGKEGEKYKLFLAKFPLTHLARAFNLTQERLEEILKAMVELQLIKMMKNKDQGHYIYIPRLRQYADIYTKRVERGYYSEQKYPKEDYLKVEKEYLKAKKITLQGNEWLPVKKEIKLMFQSGRSVQEIITCMAWMSEDEFYKDKWTMATVRKKLPEVIGKSLDQEIKKPNYARKS